jgi:hypothetical protein
MVPARPPRGLRRWGLAEELANVGGFGGGAGGGGGEIFGGPNITLASYIQDHLAFCLHHLEQVIHKVNFQETLRGHLEQASVVRYELHLKEICYHARCEIGDVEFPSVVTHPRREPPLDRRDPALPVCWMDSGAGAGHWCGGNVLVAVDEEGVGLPAADRTHRAAGLVVDGVNDGYVCFTLHIDAPNQRITKPLW